MSGTRFGQRVEPSRAALIVVDVQNDYCHPDGAFGRRGTDLKPIAEAISNVKRLVDAARHAAVPVVFLRNWHLPWTTSEAWSARKVGAGDVCQAGSWGAELYEVQARAGEPVIDKQRYSGFVGTVLDTLLHTFRRDRLVICGIATNVCVESTARHAVFLDYFVLVVGDAAATADGREVHEASLANIGRHFGVVATTEEVLSIWEQTAKTVMDGALAVRAAT